jgi:adenylosuccinate synthase
MPATVVLGGQWGDEGKGKITDALAAAGGMVVRANGGSNAGHTVETDAGVFKMHLVPSGILNPECKCVIGAGVVIDPMALASELAALTDRGIDTSNLIISDRAHVVLPFHSEIDRREENLRGERSIGTTLRGIGPAYADKVSRRGLRMIELTNRQVLEERLTHQLKVHAAVLETSADGLEAELAPLRDSLLEIGERLVHYIGPAEQHVQNALDAGVQVIVECAQGVMLDIDYGTYPFVTSSSPSTAGACQGAGVAPNQVQRVIGVFKAYSTRVGAGPMPTELLDETGALIRERGKEYGTTTGRPRRTGWFDAVAARNAVRLNGVSEIALTLADVFDVFQEISICTHYQANDDVLDYIPADLGVLARVSPVYETLPGWLENITGVRSASELPELATSFAQTIGDRAGAPVTMMGVGPARAQLVDLPTV